MPTDKRLAMLEDLVAKGAADSFTYYALALEYAGAERIDEALTAFKTLRNRDPDYVPMYLMCGTMLTRAERAGEGREWLESGLLKAKQKGEEHAANELLDALQALPPPPSIS